MRRLLLAFAFSSVVFLTTGTSQANPIISVGVSPSVSVGSVFTIPILISGATDLMAFQFDVSYDSTIIKALGFTDLGTDFETAATAGGGALTGITGFLFPGLLSGLADSMSGALSGLTGNGTLVFVQFQALAPGESLLTLSSVFLDFSELGPESIMSGFVIVGVPEPGTLALLPLGFVLLTWRRWRRTG